MSGADWALATAVVFLGAVIQGGIGFGMNLIAAPILLLLDTRFVPGPLLAAAVVMTGLVAWRDRRDMHMGEVRWAFVGRIPGTALAAIALAALSERTLSLVFGLLVLVGVGLIGTGLRIAPTRPNLIGAGVLSGFMGTTTSIGGPPMAMLYAREAGPRLRGTLSGFFLLGALVSLALVAVVGEYGWPEIGFTAGLMPGLVVGFALSARLARRLDAGHTRVAVLAVSAVAACSVLVKELL